MTKKKKQQHRSPVEVPNANGIRALIERLNQIEQEEFVEFERKWGLDIVSFRIISAAVLEHNSQYEGARV